MAYFTVETIVEGALQDSQTFYEGEDKMRQYLLKVEADAKADGLRTEVYVLYHDHDESVECECAQYVTDHRPEFSYNTEGM